jgi:D-inositol-3-phosphate glycosyltransferase
MKSNYPLSNSASKPISDTPLNLLNSMFQYYRRQLYETAGRNGYTQRDCLLISGTNVFHEWLNLEKVWSRNKVTPFEIEHITSYVSNEFHRSAILRGLNRNPSFELSVHLLDWIGKNTLNNRLILDLFTQKQHQIKHLPDLQLYITTALLEDSAVSHKRAAALLSIAALDPTLALPDDLIISLIERYYPFPSVAFSLLDYLVSHRKTDFLIQWVESTLKQTDLPFPMNLAIWLSLQQIQPSAFMEYSNSLNSLHLTPESPLFQLRSILKELHILRNEVSLSVNEDIGVTIAQFMFFGSIDQPGVGDSGGLSIFLNQLGSNLATNQEVKRVITFTTASHSSNPFPSLVNRSGNYWIISLPIHAPQQIEPEDYVAYPLQIKTFLSLFIETTGLKPDVFHLRFNDIKTRIAAEIARQMDIKSVLTLTADPHRAIEKQYENNSQISSQDYVQLNQFLFRVLIADQLLHQSSSVVILPSKAGMIDLLPYFPQLSYLIDQKSFAIIPEGIEINPSIRIPQETIEPILDKIKRSPQNPAHQHRRLILSVGRLSPVKQQDLLVEAWLKGNLWQTADLVLIGGSASNPTLVEEKMLQSIHNRLDQYPEARPYFFLLPALPNPVIRALETFLASHLDHQPPFYVCPSLKEEFGIAILEAMTAGWLAIGPIAGGLSSYIRDHSNGFLMDTSNAQSIQQRLLEILAIDSNRLQQIALKGQKTIRENYDIQRISQLLVDLYLKTASISIQNLIHENRPDYQPALLLTL